MLKKTAAALLICTLCAALAGCSKKEIELNIKVTPLTLESVVDDEITDTYTLMEKAAEDFSARYDKAEITFKVTQIEKGKSDMEVVQKFGTEDAADVMLSPHFPNFTYVYTGMAAPLDDVITGDIRSDISDRLWQDCMVDGKTYFMPFISTQNVLTYNKELFRQAGLDEFISDSDVVQSWTPEEWDYILSELRDKLPSTVYPMTMYGSGSGDTYLMTLIRSFGCQFFDEDGTVRVNTPEGIAALEWIRSCNEKGYFPPNSAALVMLDNHDLFLNRQLAICMGNIALQSFYDDAGIECGYVNFPSDEDSGNSSVYLTGFEVFDNGDADRLAAAKAFVRYIYRSDWIDYSADGIPVSRSVAEKYAEKLTGLKKYADNAKNSIKITGSGSNIISIKDAFYQNIRELLYGEKTAEQVAEKIDRDCGAAIGYGYGEIVVHE